MDKAWLPKNDEAGFNLVVTVFSWLSYKNPFLFWRVNQIPCVTDFLSPMKWIIFSFLLNSVLWKLKALNFSELHFFSIFLGSVLSLVCQRNHWPKVMTVTVYSHAYLLFSKFCNCSYADMMHDVSMFAYGVRLSFNFILCVGLSAGVPALFIEKSRVSCLETIVKKWIAFKYEW